MPKMTILPHQELCPEGIVIDNVPVGETICDILLNHDIKIFNELFKIFDNELIYNYYVKQIKRQLLGFTFGRKNSLKFSDETVENFLWKMIFRHPQLDVQRVYDGLIISPICQIERKSN